MFNSDKGFKEFLENVRRDLDKEDVARHDEDMTDLNRQELDAKIAAAEAKVDARLANFDTSVKTGFADLRAEFAELRAEIAAGRTDVMKQSNDNLKWLIGAVAGMLSLAVAVIGLMINWNKAPTPLAAPAASPAPIVVYAQPSPVTVAPPQAPAQQK